MSVSPRPLRSQVGQDSGANLSFQLPDPEDNSVSEQEFHQQVEQAWQVCDRFDLQTEIWRGRILCTVRDREKHGGDHRGLGFLNWLKEREITKSRAYSLIELANSADQLLEEGHLDPDTINQFSKRAFVETAQSAPEVQQLVSDAARDGQRITRQQVKQLTNEWVAVTSDLLPVAVREKVAEHQIAARHVAPLVRELEKLPESHQASLQTEVEETPNIETIKQTTTAARYLARYLDAAAQVRTLNQGLTNVEEALEEALRLDCLNLIADLVNQASQLEQSMAKLHTSWKRLRGLSDRLYVESGSSTPHLRSLLNTLGTLSSEVITLPLSDLQDGRQICLRVIDEEI